jgi:predicted GH43/DUF377 family glycosyl hydrolase
MNWKNQLQHIAVSLITIVLINLALISCSSWQITEPTQTPAPTQISAANIATPILGPLNRGLKLYVDKPILPLGPSGGWDSLQLDPGAVVFHDGEFHMFYNANSSWPSANAVGYAVSPDGITWTRVVMQPVFTLENIHWQSMPENIQANSVLVDGDTWVLYFSASDAVGRLTGVVGRATASSPTGPWIVDSEPVLRPGEPSEWDAWVVGHVDVINSGKDYVMYYTSSKGIGMAMSPDGIKWTKYNDPATTKTDFAKSDPVLNKPTADDPNVQQTSWGWAMVFRYEDELNYATSLDGIHWTESPDNPMVDLAGKVIWYSDFVIHDDMAFLYFEAGAGSNSPYLATWIETP